MSWRHSAGSDVTTVPSVGVPPTPPGESEPPAPSSRRHVVLGLILALMAVGLAAVLIQRANTDDGEATVASPTATAATSPVTAAPADRPPAIVNTGDNPDWDAMVRSMVAFNNWLYLHPKPELLDTFQLRSVPGYADTKLGLTNLATKGWRYDPPRVTATVEIVRLNSRVNATTAAVFVRFGPAPQYRVVDPAGNEVANQPATTVGNSVIWTLSKQADGKWYLADVDAL